VLHADDFLALMLGDGVPDGHVIGGQVQLIGAGSGSSRGNGSTRDGTGSASRWKITRCTVHRSGCGKASISCQDEPGKRTRRSLTYSPRLGELLAGKGGRVITGTGVGLNARQGGAPPDLPAQPFQLSLQRIQFGTRNADQFGCFGAHTAPSVRRFRPKCRSVRLGWADPQLAADDPELSPGPVSHGDDATVASRSMAEPWNGSWNGMQRNPSAIRVIAAIRRAISAGHVIGAGEQAPRNA